MSIPDLVQSLVFNLVLYHLPDVLRSRRRGAPTWRAALKIALTTRKWLVINLGAMCVVMAIISAVTALDSGADQDLGWRVGLAIAIGVELVLLLIWWWNDRGRKKLAAKLAGFKHRATLSRMGVRPAFG